MAHTNKKTNQRFVYDEVRDIMRPIPAGGAPEDGEQGGEDQGKGDEGSGEDAAPGAGDASSKPDGNISREEFEALEARMKAADRAKSEAEKKVREYEDKDKSELEKAQRDLDEATAARDDLRLENAALTAKLAVVTSPSAAKFYDLDDVLLRINVGDIVDDDGNVDDKKVSEVLDSLATSKPHLVKASEQGSEDEEKKEEVSRDTGKPNGRNQGSGNGSTRDSLAKKYPALRR